MPKTDGSFDPAGYATVAQRIELFYRNHPNGRIGTDLVNRDAASVTFKASVYRNDTDLAPAATGWATEREGDGDINTVACLENTETSAIGRALANLGFTASVQRPSIEEMRKANNARQYRQRDGSPDIPAASAPNSLGTSTVGEQSREYLSGRISAPRPENIAEYGPEYGPEYLHVVADLLSLLAQAERAGLQSPRAHQLRDRLEQGDTLTPAHISRVERWLRRWLDRHEDVTAKRLSP